MITSKSLRRSSAAISDGRQRLAQSPRGIRLYSCLPSRTSLLNIFATRPRQPSVGRPSAQQRRSISLWGKGSSTPNADDFAKIHTPRTNSTADCTLGHDGHILASQKAAPSPQTISAAHQTSDLPSPSPIHPEPEAIPPNVTSSPSDQFTSTFDASVSSDTLDPVETLHNIPERIGYLKEVCGIDFGWGSSSMMEMLLEHIHIYGGLPWVTSITLLAICSRLILFFPALRASDMGAQYKAAKPAIEPAQFRLSAAYKARDYAKMSEAKAEVDALNKAYGIKKSTMFLPALIQIPIQFGGFRLLRNMAELPVPALENENWLWTQDLTLSDPYFILPVANAGMVYLTIKHGGEQGTNEVQSGLKTILLYAMPTLSFLFISFQPGAVQLYFITSAVLAYAQARLITNASFRSLMGMHPLSPQSQGPIPDALSPLGTGIPTHNPTRGPTTTARTSSTTTTTTLLGPGGLKLYQPPRATSTSSGAKPNDTKPPHDVSMIDKFVDNAKAQKNEAVDEMYKFVGTTKEKRIAEAKADRVKRAAEDYEKMMAGENERTRGQKQRRH